MGKIKFTLNKTINELGISGNKLAVESKVRTDTIYSMLENKAARIHIDTLENIIDALNEIAHDKEIRRDFTIDDVMIYKK